MAITFRAAGTLTGAASTSVSLPQPANTATGDVLVAFVMDQSTTNAQSTAPTGWTAKGYTWVSGTRFQVFTAVVGQNSLSGTSWSFTGLVSRCAGQILGFYNASTAYATQPDVTTSARWNTAGSPSATGTTTITPANAGDYVIAAFCSVYSNIVTWSAAKVATTPTLAHISGGAYSTYLSLEVAGAVIASSTATGASSATMSTTTIANGGLLLSIKPPLVLPAVSVQAASNITSTACTGNANITSSGDDADCLERGVVYDTATKGTPGNVAPGSSGYASVKQETVGAYLTGAYTEAVTGLSASVTYYMRAYVRTYAGYAYSTTEVNFTTPAAGGFLTRNFWWDAY